MSFSLRVVSWSVVALGLLVRPALAEPVRIVTWNVKTLFSTADVDSRASQLQKAAATLKPDVLIVQEVSSADVVRALRDTMGLTDYHVACSDFNQDDRAGYDSLEVGIISRFPLSQVIEFDPSPDNTGKPDEPAEEKLEPELKLGIERPTSDIRGFLWCRIDDLKLTVACVHLKSSRGAEGAEDVHNALLREFVMAAVATSVNQDQLQWPEYTSIVAGDFNVGHGDKGKNGHDLAHDSLTASGGDLYDDTHALLKDGLIGGLRMTNLVEHTTQATFPAFPSTPIDNFYSIGPMTTKFAPAKIETDTFSSDHRPVWTVVEADVTPAPPLDLAAHPQVAFNDHETKSGTTSETIPTSEARKHIGETMTVEMTVAVSRDSNGIHFLNSNDDFRSSENFVAVIFKEAAEKFAAKGIDNPADHFKGKKIKVTGKIALHKNDQCQIVVDEPEQIEIVDK